MSLGQRGVMEQVIHIHSGQKIYFLEDCLVEEIRGRGNDYRGHNRGKVLVSI